MTNINSFVNMSSIELQELVLPSTSFDSTDSIQGFINRSDSFRDSVIIDAAAPASDEAAQYMRFKNRKDSWASDLSDDIGMELKVQSAPEILLRRTSRGFEALQLRERIASTNLQRKNCVWNKDDYNKMEELVEKMQETGSGIPVKTVQSFMTKIPSVFTGAELIEWVQQNVNTMDQLECLHLSHMIAAHGYLFPIDDHILTVKNDGTYYRFQTKCFWLSRCQEPDNTDYAVYLCKRTMQNKHRLELSDYEAEHLARLQKMFTRKWEFIYMQAEAQVKVDKKRDKIEKKILDSQERAFWDLHRPAPGCINTTEVDIKKACRMESKIRTRIEGCPIIKGSPIEALNGQIHFINLQLDRRRQRMSKIAENLASYSEMYNEFDPLIFPSRMEQGNPWVTDSTEFWESESSIENVPKRRHNRWGFSIWEILKDPAGREEFYRFLKKEVSAENLEFWMNCKKLKSVPTREVRQKVAEIYVAYLHEEAKSPINVDARVTESVKNEVVNNPTRYTFDQAEEHIFKLMKSDSYTRFIRSDQYKDYLINTKKVKTTPSKTAMFTKPMLMLANSSTSS